MFCSLGWSVVCCICSSWFPVSAWICIHNIINLLLSLDSSTWVQQAWLVEWFRLIKSVSIFGSNNISMQIFISLPWCFIKQLGISLESTGKILFPTIFVHWVIKFTFSNRKFLNSIWLRSKIWFQVCFSECRTPIFLQSFMLSEFGPISVASKLIWPSFIEGLLICLKIDGLPFGVCVLKFIFLRERSSCDFWIWSTELWVSFYTRNESSIFWNNAAFGCIRSLKNKTADIIIYRNLPSCSCLCSWFCTY